MLIAAHRCHILHVTDNDDDHCVFGELTKKNSTLALDRAKTAAQALSTLESCSQAERANLVLIDWLLPGEITGGQLLAAMKDNLSFKSIPVLVLTGFLEPGDLDKIYGLGASCVVRHDLVVGDFAETVAQICRFWGDIASLPFCEPIKAANF